jgi:hypothetical protein
MSGHLFNPAPRVGFAYDPHGDGGLTDPGCLSGSSFLHPIDAHRPRTLQFGLKLSF